MDPDSSTTTDHHHHRVDTEHLPDFSSELTTLKEDGCALLVTGALPLKDHRRAARHMLGNNGSTARHCLLVYTNTDPLTVDDSFHTTCTDHGGDSLILNATPHSRTITAHLEATPPLPEISLPPHDLGELILAISETITAISHRQQPRGLSPAALRVWIDSLSPLLQQSEERVMAFLSLLSDRISSVDGMGIVHLNVEPDAEIVETVEPVFDAVVELRIEEGQLQQRWRLRESNLVTGWIPLSESTP